WRNAEYEGDLRHQALRLGTVETVANDRSTDDHAGSGRNSLQRAEQPQRLNVAGDRAAERSERKQTEAGDDDRSATERIGERAMPQHHERIRKQVGRKRLLN